MTDRITEGADTSLSLIARLINIATLVVSIFLLARIVLRLFSANPSTPFVAFIYNFTDFLISPFRGILPQTNIGQFTVDTPAFVALVVYLFISYLVLYFLSIMRPYRHGHAHEAHSH